MAALLFLLVASALLLAPPSAAGADVTAAPEVADSSSPDLAGALGEQLESFLNRMEKKIGNVSPMVTDDGKTPAEKIKAALKHIEAVKTTAAAATAPKKADEPHKPIVEEAELTVIITMIEQLIKEIESFLNALFLKAERGEREGLEGLESLGVLFYTLLTYLEPFLVTLADIFL
ncbi:unnamed protein product [Vitrella brassicaformis CCMP3155]|uniref:Uncharacterized protein n=2 Tax=Vitrella brassicaformis TaxID=1169539 RepID=A0A0G4EU77_VITBC|nr:unnamed protein product [Vitrella brassicaformis CCMP3155]|eukprot:CEM01640.1 unnamed protein product [Vitrella brassicaformis CCMP3155]